jgi:ribosomal subunit interface protein
MQLDIRGKNVKVSEDRRQLIQKKLGKLDRYLESLGEATVELATENGHKGKGGEGRLVVEMTVRTPSRALLRAEERDNDLGAALDRLQEKMQGQITRFKDRMVHHKGRPRVGEVATILQEAEEATTTQTIPELDKALELVRVKNFKVKPMYVDEAVEQMELLEHSFFVFQDAETGKISVAYRRNDGSYGLIRPELE